jgi:hypothetical protein
MADSRRDLEREDLDKKNANDEQNQQELIDNTEKQVTRRMKR